MSNTPQFKSPALPSIESFKLDNILSTTLLNESNQVKSDVLNITNNYQQDLSQGIKTNLVVEQKIQSKNIDVVKLAHGINNQVKYRRKKLTKVNNTGDPEEVNKLLKNTVIVSDKVKSLVDKLYEIELLVNGRVNPSLYPNVNKILLKRQQKTQVQPEPPTPPLTPVELAKPVESPKPLISPRPSSPESLEPPESPVRSDSESTEIIPYSPKLPSTNLPHPPISNHEPDEIMDPDQFELFMSDSISKYRHRKSIKKHIQEHDHIEQQQQIQQHTIAQPISNPLNLLYSQLVPKSSQQFLKSPYPFVNNLTMKSIPISKPTLQTSHFKKLRINGDPIGSTRHDGCGCISPNQSEQELALQQEADSIDWQGLSLDEEMSDTDTSESDSENDDDSSLPMITNQYYTSLKKAAHTRKRVKQQQEQEEQDVSPMTSSPPTPKHKPSHHILKPKRSILKTSDPIRFSKENSPYIRAINANNIIPDAVSIVNNKYASKIEYPISDFTVNGVILEQQQEDCVQDSIKSISVLKNYIN
ncbi:hypothetical protein JA1_004426 [Spathaspora sp. JA1]|nr:hypothetical protein JA1_004426 [Spathaspora sp. JA1]